VVLYWFPGVCATLLCAYRVGSFLGQAREGWPPFSVSLFALYLREVVFVGVRGSRSVVWGGGGWGVGG